MKTFTDNTGRTWTIAINIGEVKRVKDLLAVDLLEAVNGKLVQELIDDPVLLCDLVYCLCKNQADAAGISDEQFGCAMAGDAIDLATTALLEELVDFFPQRRRVVLAKAMSKARALESMGIEAASKYLDSDLPEKAMAEKIDELLKGSQGSGGLSGSLPESSESTPPS